MAKRQAASESTIEAAEHKIEEFAEDLGRLLKSAQTKAEGWMGQRKYITDHLTGIRDTATGLLAQLGVGGGTSVTRRSGRSLKRSGSAAAAAATPSPSATGEARKPRTMSAEARARIGAAQRKRWARLRKAQNR